MRVTEWANRLDNRVLGRADRLTVGFNGCIALLVLGMAFIGISVLRGDSNTRALLTPLAALAVLLLARRGHVRRLRQRE